VAGPNGSRDRALARFWEVALVAFKERAEAGSWRAVGPGQPHDISSPDPPELGRGRLRGRGGWPMSILLIEYRVEDFSSWKAVFDQDPMGRRTHGVTHHRIYRDSDDPDHLMLSLEFPSDDDAKRFRRALEPVRDMSGAAGSWVLQELEEKTY
jgi:hypothetical protein